MDLLPLTFQEIASQNKRAYTTDELVWMGAYPEIYDRQRNPAQWYPAYIRTYVERDVKQLRNIENTILFNRFLQLCAGRIGQQLNIAALSIECGIDVKTVQSWLSILQTSYIVFLLAPHFKNFKKRIVKTPKLYFYDTGLACSLLGIRQKKEIQNSHFRGALFENFVILELLKQKHNKGSQTGFYYWRDNKGVEIDLVLDNGSKQIPVEIKSAQTFHESYLANILRWNEYARNRGGILLYDGKDSYNLSNKIKVSRWNDRAVLKGIV